MALTCIFCTIARGEDEKTKILYNDDKFVVFSDIRPATPHHYLVVPKSHIADAKHLNHDHKQMVEQMMEIGSSTVQAQGGDINDLRMGFHWPPFSTINHLHLHVISSTQQMGWISRGIFKPNSFWFVTHFLVLMLPEKLNVFISYHLSVMLMTNCWMSRFVEYRGTMVHKTFERDKLSGFKGQYSDIWVCGFPRSGVDACEAMAAPRMFKSHLHYFLLPDDVRSGMGKIIYVARHPAPTVISLFGLMKYFRVPEATNLREFVELFLQDKAYACPWWLHVQQYWAHRENKHILFLQFDDIVKDKRSVIYSIADFLDRKLSEEDVDKIIDHTNIDNMRGNDMVNFSFTEKYLKVDKTKAFINKGSLDDWKTTLPEDLKQRIELMLTTRFKDTELTFD